MCVSACVRARGYVCRARSTTLPYCGLNMCERHCQGSVVVHRMTRALASPARLLSDTSVSVCSRLWDVWGSTFLSSSRPIDLVGWSVASILHKNQIRCPALHPAHACTFSLPGIPGTRRSLAAGTRALTHSLTHSLTGSARASASSDLPRSNAQTLEARPLLASVCCDTHADVQCHVDMDPRRCSGSHQDKFGPG